jgi:thioredoxin-dependent peroxiredoxin
MLTSVKLLEAVPPFECMMTGENTFSLHTYIGKIIVLFFYPRDNTPGCTIENQEFSQLQEKFKLLNAFPFGISRDPIKSHLKFQTNCKLSIPLLSDEDESICTLFDVIKNKTMYGKPVRGIERSTFVIDEKGILIHEWRKVKAEGHAEEVLAWLTQTLAKC